MKRIFCLILFLLLTVQPAFATINYCKWDTGDDSGGDGSSGNPYKTIQKCTNGLTGGDECRVSKSGAHTTLSGTLTFTDDSATVSTSVDLTSTVSQYDMIGKDADDGMWWEVSSINSTTITLSTEYIGTSETVTGYKMTAFDLGDLTYSQIADYVDSDGSSNSSRIVISGGWDLSGPTQNGETYFIQTGTAVEGYCLQNSGDDYITIKDLHYARCLYGVSVGNNTDFIGDSFKCSRSGLYCVSTGTDTKGPVILKNINCTQGSCINSASVGSTTLQNITSISKNGIHINIAPGNWHGYTVLDNITIDGFGSAGDGINIAGVSSVFGKDLSFTECLSSLQCVALELNSTAQVHLNNVSFADGYYTYEFNSNMGYGNLYIYGYSVSNMGATTPEYTWNLRDKGHYLKQTMAEVYEEPGQQYLYAAFGNGGVVSPNTAEARSGTCLEYRPPTSSTLLDQTYFFLGQIEPGDTDLQDVVCSVFAKANATYTTNSGEFAMAAIQAGRNLTDWVTSETLSTSYKRFKVITEKETMSTHWPVECWAKATDGENTAARLYLDDFSAWQQ